MLNEKAMVKIRWLALGSALAFFAIMNVSQLRGLLLLIAAGVLYNLLLSSVGKSDLSERLKGLSTLVDMTGLAFLIFNTGGPNSIFVFYMAVYLFIAAVRHGVFSGVVLAVLASLGLSYYYFQNPTQAVQTAVLTRGLVFLIAPLGALVIDVKGPDTTEKIEAPEAGPQQEVAEKPETVEAKEEIRADSAAAEAEETAEADQAESAEVEQTVEPEPLEEPEPEYKPEPEPETESRAKAEEPVPVADTLAEEVGITGEAGMPPGVPETKLLRERITELAILHEASKALGASLIMEEVLDTVIDISAKGLHADIAGALVFDEKTGLMTVTGLRGFSAEEREVINSTTFTPGEGILGDVFLKKKTFNLDDLSEERPGSAPFNGRIKSFIATPLSTDGFEIGVLFLGKFVKEPFGTAAVEFIETISGQAAIAVENARLYTQAQELAIHNGLTGIYNYRYFMKQLDEEIKRAERYGRSVSLMMIDIDLFKNVNDTYGHQRGDDVLKGLAQTLVNNTRETDIVARYGGEEFCVILPETDLADALDVAEKLRTSVAKASYARDQGHSVKITISIGVATFPEVANNQEDLLRKSDDALYAAKTKRNKVVSAGAGQQSVK